MAVRISTVMARAGMPVFALSAGTAITASAVYMKLRFICASQAVTATRVGMFAAPARIVYWLSAASIGGWGSRAL